MSDIEQVPFTREGYQELSQELERLKKEERPKIIEEIATARGHGDLKENAEYHAAREKQGMIEAKIAELEDRLARGKIVDFADQDVDQVRFGSYVTVADQETEEEKTYRIVGDLEADISKNRISTSSPIAKALLGRKLDDYVEVNVPKGVMELVITNITYK